MLKLCVLLAAVFPAHGTVLFASLGENVSLPCYFEPGAKYLCWYKQVAGDKPQVVSSLYVFAQNSHNYLKTTEQVKRLAPYFGKDFFHLNISNVQLSDTAMYYCGNSNLNVMSFDSGIFLLVKESSRLAVIQQPPSITVSPGGSAALNCIMHPGSNEGGNVYWFWKASSNSNLGMLYIQSQSSGGCVETSETGCIFLLSKREVALADAGTYYCAVASCGEIVFGNGTKLDVGDEKTHFYSVLAQCLLASLLVSVIVNVFLTRLLCKKSGRDNLPTVENDNRASSLKIFKPKNVCQQSEEALPYVALDFKKRQSNSRRQKGPEDSVYSGLRLKNVE
ncbi:uncharacterized protein LOC130928685 [Corythoichthys intestinalis]|uniref:uncharacterized protein LOC130928685 n=1 Tax=Corythoichthys intestinalis TaxID=161448 RepID=UPI0025A55F1B|nr:uncharacterized protein LOC130928685 [Corythoichthys intestinalis]